MSNSFRRNFGDVFLCCNKIHLLLKTWRPQNCMLSIVSLLGHAVQSSVRLWMHMVFHNVFHWDIFCETYAFSSLMLLTEWSRVVVCSIVCVDLGVRTERQPLCLCDFKRRDDILLMCGFQQSLRLYSVKTRFENLCHDVCHVEWHLKQLLIFLHFSYCRNKPSIHAYSFIVYVLSFCYITKHFDML